MADEVTPTNPTPAPVKDPNAISKLFAQLLLDVNTKEVSWSKVWSLITVGLGFVIALQDQIIAAGISIPPSMMPIFKGAALLSGTIALIRIRNTIQK